MQWDTVAGILDYKDNLSVSASPLLHSDTLPKGIETHCPAVEVILFQI
jgi:hypothetical protein